MMEYILLKSRIIITDGWNKYPEECEYIPIIKDENEGEEFLYVFLTDIYKKKLTHHSIKEMYTLYFNRPSTLSCPIKTTVTCKSDDEFFRSINPFKRAKLEVVYRYEIRKRNDGVYITEGF